jgi:peptidoglycan/LPS O-acetylase OafA/YrhL
MILGTTATIPDSDSFRGDIQGLRAIAVLAVILFHVNKEWLPGGFVGVDVFFVISGFLIGGIILKKRGAGTFSLRDFYIGRVKRIIPVYVVLLAVTAIVAAVLFAPKDFGFFRDSAKSALYFGSNGYFSKFGDYFAPSVHELPLLHTWSLAVEMQFYLLLPIALIMLPQRLWASSLMVALIVLVGYGFREVNFGQRQTAYFSLLVRIPEFLLGVGLAVFESGRGQEKLRKLIDRSANWIGAMAFILLVGSFWLISENSAFPGFWVLAPCIGAVVVMGARNSAISLLLAHPALVWIGGLSYSLYLWHWPILAFLRYVVESYQLSIDLLVVFLVLLLILSYASLQWIEIPYRRRMDKTSSSVWRMAMLIVGVAIPLSLASMLNAAIDDPLPVAYTRYAAGDEICHGRVVKDCIRGAREAATEPILVLGDSHAAQLNIFFDTVGKINGQRFRVISASSCVTIPEFDVIRLPDWARADCQASIKFAKRYLAESKVIVIAGMWQYQISSVDFIKAFRAFLADADVHGKSVIVLAQIPMLTSNVLRLRRFEKLGISNQVSLHPEWFQANSAVRNIVSEYGSARFVDFSGYELFAHAPFLGERLIYHDNHHLNEIGADEYAKIAAQSFENQHN